MSTSGRKPDAGQEPAGLPSKRRARHRARELALQGVYQWLLSGGSVSSVREALELDDIDHGRADEALFTALLKGAINNAAELRSSFSPLLSRPVSELSPIEHAILLIATHELCHSLEVPYRVIINEAIELAKAYGGTDGHKFVNGVLDQAAARLRSAEVEALRSSRR